MNTKIPDHKIVAALSGMAVALVIGGFFWAYTVLSRFADSPLILHFNDIDGITKVGSLRNIVFMGIFGLIVVVLDGWIAFEWDDHDRIMGKIIAGVGLAFAILLFIAFAAIINVN